MPTIWLLGLSGSGKTVLGSLLRLHLEGRGLPVAFIDSDAFSEKHGFDNSSAESRRIGANALRDHVLDVHAQEKICVVAAVTPYAEMRRENRDQIPLYREVWVRCALTTLVARDPKGFYARAMHESMPWLSGFTDTFDEPSMADCIVDTDRLSLGESYEKLRDFCHMTLEEGENFRHWIALPRGHVRPDAYGSVWL